MEIPLTLSGNKEINVLIIDDDIVDIMRTNRLLFQIKTLSFLVSEANTISDAITKLEMNRYDLIFLDYKLPDGEAVDFLKKVKADEGNLPPIIIQTVLEDDEKALETVALGAQDFLIKGKFDYKILERAIRYSIQRDFLVKERERLRVELERANKKIAKLEGLLPLCSYCKRIRKDNEEWEEVDQFIVDHSDADVSHSICPNCLEKYQPEVYLSLKAKGKI